MINGQKLPSLWTFDKFLRYSISSNNISSYDVKNEASPCWKKQKILNCIREKFSLWHGATILSHVLTIT